MESNELHATHPVGPPHLSRGGELLGLMGIAAWVGLGAALCTLVVPGWDFFLSALLIPLVVLPLGALRRSPMSGILLGTTVGEAVLGFLAQKPFDLESQRFEEFTPWQISLTYTGVAVAVGLILGAMGGILLRDLRNESTLWQPAIEDTRPLPPEPD